VSRIMWIALTIKPRLNRFVSKPYFDLEKRCFSVFFANKQKNEINLNILRFVFCTLHLLRYLTLLLLLLLLLLLPLLLLLSLLWASCLKMWLLVVACNVGCVKKFQNVLFLGEIKRQSHTVVPNFSNLSELKTITLFIFED